MVPGPHGYETHGGEDVAIFAQGNRTEIACQKLNYPDLCQMDFPLSRSHGSFTQRGPRAELHCARDGLFGLCGKVSEGETVS